MRKEVLFTKNAHEDSFIKVPKKLFTEPEYKSLSAESKLMYGLLLDRESLSRKNGWLDDSGRVFIYYTLDEMSKDLGCGRTKTARLYSQLREKRLIKKKNVIKGKPSAIYVNRVSNTDGCEFQNKTRPSSEKEHDRVPNMNRNKTEMNNTEFSDTDTYCTVSEAEIREQIEYDCLCPVYGRDSIDGIVCLISDTLSVKSKEIRIGDSLYPSQLVKKRLRSLNSEHIGYALEVMSETENTVVNIKKYLLTVLFHAPSCMDSYFENKFRSAQNFNITR